MIRGVLVPMEDSTVQRKRRRAAKGEYTCCMVDGESLGTRLKWTRCSLGALYLHKAFLPSVETESEDEEVSRAVCLCLVMDVCSLVYRPSPSIFAHCK